MADDRKAKRESLRAGGISYGKSASVVDNQRGFSRSNLSLLNGKDARAAYDLMHTRDLWDEKVVAVQIDTTYFPKFRTSDRKLGVMIATGITADGRRLALAIGMTQAESAEDYRSLIDNFISRGVSPNVLFTVDAAPGIRKALTDLTGEVPPQIQICTSHAARNVEGHMEDAMPKTMPEPMRQKEVDGARSRMYRSWAEDDPDIAVKRLDSIGEDLLTRGYVKAAGSLWGSMQYTVTVQRLGIVGELREILRNTNGAEAINSMLKDSGMVEHVTIWKHGEMVLHHVALELMDLERNTWTPLPEPAQLVAQLERAMPGAYDLEPILETLPPSMTVNRLPIYSADVERTRRIASRWLAEHPGAIPIGAPDALAALGLAENEVTPDLLHNAMEGRDPETGARLLKIKEVPIVVLGDEGEPQKMEVDGIFNASWRLVASRSAMREWRRGGAAQEKVEAKLMEAASAAVERATLTTRANEGFAAVAALQRPTADAGGQHLYVAGITFAVQRGKGAKLTYPATREMLAAKTLRAAERVAQAVLDGRPREAPAPAPQAAAPSPPARGGPAPISPELLAAVSARALELAPSMLAAGRAELLARAADLAAARAGLGKVAGEVSDWQKQNWRDAVRQLTAAALLPDRSSDPFHRIGGPLGRGHRVVLGEMRSQWLLGNAAFEVGRAEGDAAAARVLRTAGVDALAELAQPVARVEAAARALAAHHELVRRSRFRSAQKGNPRDAPPPPTLRDSLGVLHAPPIHRFRSALGRERAAALDHYAQALAPRLNQMSGVALQRLAANSKRTWDLFAHDVTTGVVHTGLEKKRDIALEKGLETLQTAGRETGDGEAAVRRGAGAAFIEADKRADAPREQAGGHWDELREIEERLAERRQAAGSPESLIEKYPKAAIYHAAFVELLRREQERDQLRASAAEPAPPVSGVRGKDADRINQQGMNEPTNIPGLPTKPLRDSLAANLKVLGVDAALRIKAGAEKRAAKDELHHLSEEELLEALPDRDPFAALPKGRRRDPQALSQWWRENGEDATRTVALQGQLIDNASRAYAELAERESDHRGESTANPLAAVREVRGEEFAAKVARRAAVLASHLDSLAVPDRHARTVALRKEIHGDGLDKARFESIAQVVALQHGRNAENEQERQALAAREADAGADVSADPNVVIEVGADVSADPNVAVDAGTEVGADPNVVVDAGADVGADLV